MTDIFISKSTKDDKLALSIFDILEENGIDCWIANRDLHTSLGDMYAEDLYKAILNSKALLLLLSSNSNMSEHVLNEVSTACDHRIPVFVLQIEEVDVNMALSYYLSKGQWIIDYDVPKTGNYEKITKQLLIFLKYKNRIDSGHFSDTEYIRKRNFKQLQRETQEKRQSYIMSIADGDEREYDNHHFYERIIRIDIVDSKKNSWSSYRFLTIKNESDVYTNHLIHKECGEDKANFKSMRIRARMDGIHGEKLSIESLTPIQPNLQQVFRINFRAPLKPGDNMTIFYRLDWPNEPSSYYKNELSQSISLSRYRKGIGNLVFGVFEPYSFISSSMREVNKMNEQLDSNVAPEILTIQDEPLLEPLHEQMLNGVKYNIKHPSSILYQILYKLENADEFEDDDDFF